MDTKHNSEILDRFKKGRALDHIPVIDTHFHYARSSHYYAVPYSRDEQINGYLDRYGVDHVWGFPLNPISDMLDKNRSVYEYHRAYPGRITPLTSLNAGFPDDWIEELKEGAENGGRGIKLIPSIQCSNPADVDLSVAFDFARGRNWIVLNHSWIHRDNLARWAKAYPDITFLLGHPLAGYDELINTCDNIYMSLCGLWVEFWELSMDYILDHISVEKILYSSDAVDLDLSTGIGPVVYADIPEWKKEAILGGNALRLMKKLGWPVADEIMARYGDRRG